MKRRVMLTVFAIVVIGFVFLFVGSCERQFEWNRYSLYLHDDDEPFGCELFDKMAEATLPNGYEYYEGDLGSLVGDGKRRSLLLVCGAVGNWQTQAIQQVDSFVKQGNKLMIVCERNNGYITPHWMPTFFGYANFDLKILRMTLEGRTSPDTLVRRSNGDLFSVPTPLLTSYIHEDEKVGKVTSTVGAYRKVWKAEDDEEGNYVMSSAVRVGKGSVYFVSCPLMFTNYGVLDTEISRFVGWQMSQIADYPVTRIPVSLVASRATSHGDGTVTTDSPLKFMLNRPPLRWAIYTLVAAIILFMLFNARRRQRVIPVREAPVNRNLSFVQLLGTIYYRRHDNADLMRKKYTYFREELRRTLMLDLDNLDGEASNVTLLAQKTGLPERQVADTLTMARGLCAPDMRVTNAQLREGIDRMNDILRHLQY